MDDWVLVCVALVLLVYASGSARLQSIVVTQAMVFVAFGLLIGNRALGVVDVEASRRSSSCSCWWSRATWPSGR